MTIPDCGQFIQAERLKRLRRDWLLTPEERLERFAALQRGAEQLLASNPTALAQFHRRNRQKRLAARVRELETHWRCQSRNDGQP